MRNQVRLRVFLASALLLSCSESTPDVVERAPTVPATPVAAAVALGATPLAIDARGLPRMLRGGNVAPAPAATAFESARVHLTRFAPAWGVSTMPELVLAGELATQGGRIARIKQVIDGLPIDRGELRVMIGDGGTLIASSGVLYAGDAPRTQAVFAQDDAGAIARAVSHTHDTAFDAKTLITMRSKADGSRVVGGTAGNVHVELARATQAWYPVDGVLVAAWIVEAYTSSTNSTDSELYRTVLSADGRRVLEHRSLTVDVAFKYKLFVDPVTLHPLDGPLADASPHPAGAPNGFYPEFITPTLVEVDGLNKNPSGGTDPWLLSTRLETQGNNVDAYADFNAPTGFTNGDFRASTTTTRTFDRAFSTSAEPGSSQSQQMAAITSLFYAINWLHDFWYDAGFTEATGNAQDNNYGRGGEDRDAINAEAQDFSGRNNANMSTPDDGLPPRMQVFLWSGRETRTLTVSGNTYPNASASWGPKTFDVTSTIALSNDAAGTPTDGCDAHTVSAVQGKIVLVDRGTCSFKRKALNIQQAGGIGMILANNVAGVAPPGMGDDSMLAGTTITIAALSVTMEDGAAFKTALQGGSVTARLNRVTEVDRDGSLDATLVAHEFGHYLHHRLSLCSGAICGAMSEGWGDFLALMLLAKPGDNLDGAYPFSIYTTISFSDDPAYYGIRRAPFSANKAINSLAFRHMGKDEPLPTTHPFQAFGHNSEVHNAGEVWAQVLWDAYVALQKAGSNFDDVRKKMAKYVVAGLLLMPVDASITEARDAILTAIHAASPADHDIVAAAFAGRGFGSCAVSPTIEVEAGTGRQHFVGIVESDEVAGRAEIGALANEAGTSCDDDKVLDPGETLKITIPVTNRGHKPLSNASATLTTTTAGITVVSQPVLTSTIPAYGSANVTAEIKLDGQLDAPTAGEFTLAIAAADGCEAMTTAPFVLRLNADDVPESAAIDTFDAGTSIWTVTQSDVPIWTHERRAESALDGYWRGDDLGATSDTSLVSPTVTVSDQQFVVTASHRYEFEYDGTGTTPVAFDGGVIEYSIDAGATWKDVSEIATPGYNGTLDAGNALGARQAFVNKNAMHPAAETLTLDFGTQLAGKQVQLRFRIGTDAGVGAPGWEVDHVEMRGIVGTPFPTQVADATACGTEPPKEDDDGGGCCDAGPIAPANVGAVFGVLALLLRRRRRRS